MLPFLTLVALTSSTATVADVSTATVSAATVRPEDANSRVDTPGPTYTDVLLFLPRLVLTPVRYTLALVAWPLRKGLELVEEYRVIEHTIDLLYNDARTAGFFPTVDFFSSQGTTVGGRLFHNDVFGHGESVAVSAKLGGLYAQGYAFDFGADRLADTPLWIEGSARWERRPRLYFEGIGNLDTTTSFTGLQDPYVAAVPTRFAQERVLGRLRLGTTHGPADGRVKIGTSLFFNHRHFGPAERLGADERSIETVYDTSRIVGFDEGFSLFEVTADLVLDFRNRPGQTSRGFFFEAFAGGVPEQDGRRFFHWGADLAVFIEVFAATRVLVLHGAVEGVEGERERIPFTELPRLGGAGRLRGYQVDHFRGEKAAITSLEYHYPIHQLLRGVLFVDAGRVADSYGDLFDTYAWRYSAGGGLKIGTEESTWLQIDLAYGDGLFLTISSAPFRSFSGRTERL